MKNREIKFKAFDTLDNTMGTPFNPFDPVFLSDGGTFPDTCIFLQYIGLKDKNGKEIYEGDVINVHNFEIIEQHEDGSEVFGDCVSAVEYKGASFHFRSEFCGDVPLDVLDSDKIEVIANIYSNSELLKP